MGRISILPNWVMRDTLPSAYDVTSGSWIEATSGESAALAGLTGAAAKEYNTRRFFNKER